MISSSSRLSASDAEKMAGDLIASLRVLDDNIKASIDIEADEMSRSKGSRNLFKRIREVMLTQLGATEVDKINNNQMSDSTVYFLEVGEQGDETLYLCRSSCSKAAPLVSWTSERVLSLGKHALKRAFMHRCAWACGYAVTVESLMTDLCALYISYSNYLLLHGGELVRIAQQGWNTQCSAAGSQFVIQHEAQGVPLITTVFKSRADSPEDGVYRMIPPKGRFGLPRLVTQFSIQS
jgi:GTP-dependent phosphoenolpyruvate carboxykinase